MKIKILSLILAVFAIASFAACSTDKSTQGEPVVATTDKNAEEIATIIKDNVTMKDGTNLIESDRNAENAYPGIMEMVDEYAIYVNATGGYAEEVAVFKFKDEISEEEIQGKLDERTEYQKNVFEDYQPREMPKLETPVISKIGNYTIFVVVDDPAEAKAAIEKAA